jgi:hypothetical protein
MNNSPGSEPNQMNEGPGQIAVPGGTSALVVDYGQAFPLLRQSQNGVGKASSHSAEQPGSPHNATLRKYLPDSLFRLSFGMSIGIDWRNSVFGRVWSILGTVKDVVGAEENKPRPGVTRGQGNIHRAQAVHFMCAPGIFLAAVYVSVRRGQNGTSWLVLPQEILHVLGAAQVPVA